MKNNFFENNVSMKRHMNGMFLQAVCKVLEYALRSDPQMTVAQLLEDVRAANNVCLDDNN